MAEIDPSLVEAAYDVEAVMQIRKLGTRSTEQKEEQLWWEALQRYRATHEGVSVWHHHVCYHTTVRCCMPGLLSAFVSLENDTQAPSERHPWLQKWFKK